MGELVDLAEWKRKQEEKEDKALKDDIEQLRLELASMIDEMESDAGPYLYPQEMIDVLPQLQHIDSILDGYYDTWIGLGEAINLTVTGSNNTDADV